MNEISFKNTLLLLRDDGLSYQKIGDRFHISRQRVHQIVMNYRSPSSLERRGGKNRIKAITRDDYTCQFCGDNKNAIHLHHLDENWKNNLMNNLMTLCKSCHYVAHRYKER